jgi:hypothetical protein
MTIQIILEPESNKDNDPLVLRESINSLVESIESSIYNINETYREYIRKIRNRLNQFDSKETSDNVFFEYDEINDDNIIESVNNILEITIDLTLHDLIENNYPVGDCRSISDLIEFNHSSTDNLKYIIDQSKHIIDYYQENNDDKEFDLVLFYEILDESIANITTGKTKTRPILPDQSYITRSILDIAQEDYYNYIISHLDDFVGEDLKSTKNNIKNHIINEANSYDVFGGVAGAGPRPRPINQRPGNNNPQRPQSSGFTGFLVAIGLGGFMTWAVMDQFSDLFNWLGISRAQRLEAKIDNLKDKKEGLEATVNATKQQLDEMRQLLPPTFAWVGFWLSIVALLLYFLYDRSITAQDFVNRLKILHSIKKEIKHIQTSLPSTIGSPKVKSFLSRLDVEANKCIKNSSARSKIDAMTICFENYINGVMTLLIFESFMSLRSDGVDFNKFRKFDNLYSYSGFASEKSRVVIRQLHDLHDYNVKYMEKSGNYNLVDFIDSTFNSVKEGINKNSTFDQIWNKIPKIRN